MISEKGQKDSSYLVDVIIRLSDAVSAVLVLAITGLVAIQVVWRYFLNHSLTWTEGFAMIGVIWLAVASGIGTEGQDTWIRLEWMDRILALLGITQKQLYLLRRTVVFAGAITIASSNLILSQELGTVKLLGTSLGRDLIHLVIGGLFGLVALIALIRGVRAVKTGRLIEND